MVKKIGIIDLKLSNLGSIINAVKFCGAEPVLIDNFKDMINFNHIIFPGIGSFNFASKIIKKKKFKIKFLIFLLRGENFLEFV